jgi:hypothetical protein
VTVRELDAGWEHNVWQRINSLCGVRRQLDLTETFFLCSSSVSASIFLGRTIKSLFLHSIYWVILLRRGPPFISSALRGRVPKYL